MHTQYLLCALFITQFLVYSNCQNVEINEISAADNTIELRNPGGVSLVGWTLQFKNLQSSLTITADPPAGQFQLLNLGQLQAGFSLLGNGDTVSLFPASSSTAASVASYYALPAYAPQSSWGLYDVGGRSVWTLLTSKTLGATNSVPFPSPLVITEIHYWPGVDVPDAFFLVQSTSDQVISLSRALFRSGGQPFFPGKLVIPPYGKVILSSLLPSTHRKKYGTPQQIQIFGPVINPTTADSASVSFWGTTAASLYPMDTVDFAHSAPWPTDTFKTGYWLIKNDIRVFGNDPLAWNSTSVKVSRLGDPQFQTPIPSTINTSRAIPLSTDIKDTNNNEYLADPNFRGVIQPTPIVSPTVVIAFGGVLAIILAVGFILHLRGMIKYGQPKTYDKK